ncbi:N-acetylmuramoyl-L-alanine amidase, partial [Escherichia coli]|nr:N-acetylmuramoyl-L-alanine amidase [Escherichia coli]
IGIEHEGYAAQGAQWFTQAMYSTSAKLVSYLAKKYQIPLDRAHIIEHGQVPAINRAGIPAMHWDPGP